ncbi:MAG TPA: Hsp20/alpha crystallin family protein [Candidatus Paceibacterota bacterium]|nr:Hsp20/alpha crystallin family protein [Candidatus Paceibacterota bacterium]
MIKKPSFLERLTGGTKLKAQDDEFEDETEVKVGMMDADMSEPSAGNSWGDESESDAQEGELPVDMYQTRDSIVIRALVAGVNPEDLDIAITRDMVTLKGTREENQEAPDEDYYHRELFWGSFSRTILLPEEIVIDEAEAKEKHGLLEIILPKLDKERSARLTVKSHHINVK